MAQTKKKSIFFVVALVVLAALIVILATTLSACSGDEDEKTEPTPTETVQPEATTETGLGESADRRSRRLDGQHGCERQQ